MLRFSNTLPPMLCSTACTVWLNADWERKSLFAAAEKLPSRAAIARVAQQVKSETARTAILNELDGEMDENDGLQA